MSMKEKYEKACTIKDRALSLVCEQLNGDISSVDAKELGEVADIAKDMAQMIKYCEEAKYYHEVTEAMEDAEPEEKSYYLNKYIPEYRGKFYNPMITRKPSKYMYTPYYHIDPWMNYGDEYEKEHSDRIDDKMSSHGMTYDSMMGDSGLIRRNYMDMKRNGEDIHMTEEEMKKYMNTLKDDFDDMLKDATAVEKAHFKNSLITYVNNM